MCASTAGVCVLVHADLFVCFCNFLSNSAICKFDLRKANNIEQKSEPRINQLKFDQLICLD